MVWKPRVTVALVVESEGRFLMVEERTTDGIRFNQPAGHLEDNESLISAAVRECREETARHFTPEALVGLYRWRNPHNGDTFLRATFCGSCGEPLPGQALDPDIIAVHWLKPDELRDRQAQLRSPLVMQSLNDYLQGKRYPLALLIDQDTEF